jgi:phage tail tube protein FII
MNRFLHLEDVNMYCGVGNPASQASSQVGSDSNHLILTELQLPRFQEQNVDHRAGGAALGIEVDVQFQKLEATFVMAGLQPQIMKLMFPSNANQTYFTCYGVVRDVLDGTYAQAFAQMYGRLGSVELDNWRRGTTLHTKYAIRSILRYRLEIAGFGTMIDFDFYLNKFYVG